MTWINAIQTTLLEDPPSIDERISVAKDLVIKSGVLPQNIGVVLSTGIDVFLQPSDSVAIASGIEAKHALCATINNSCASFSAALELTISKINGQPKDIGVVTSSSIFNEIYRDGNLVVCANGVGAAIISNNREGLRIKNITHQNNASFFGLKTIEVMHDKVYKFNEIKNDDLWKIYRQEVINFPIEVIKDTLSDNGWDIFEVDNWVFHSSELTKSWIVALGLNVKSNFPNMGALTSLAQLDKLLVSKTLMQKSKIVVLEIALGMSVSIILLENDRLL